MYNCYGLTGGIASGKSTVAKQLRQLGVPVVDADALYHRLIAPTDGHPSPLAQAIDQAFGQVLLADGSIDRATVGSHVFADAAQRQRLEAITHPAVSEAAQGELNALRKAGHRIIFYDVPLLYERSLQSHFIEVVVVWVPKELQIQRLMARNQLSLVQAEARLAAQMPLEQKRAFTPYVIDNSATHAHTCGQVAQLVQKLRGTT